MTAEQIPLSNSQLINLHTEAHPWLPDRQHLAIFAGPCSSTSIRHILAIAAEIADAVDGIRTGIKKPRTRPVDNQANQLFHGVGIETGQVIHQALRTVHPNLLITTEVMSSDDIHQLHPFIDLPWIGSRNATSQETIQDIASACSKLGLPLAVKNQLPEDNDMVLGALEHAMIATDQPVILLLRGFHTTDPSWRNRPNLHLIRPLKDHFPNLQILFDPCHIPNKHDPHFTDTVLDLSLAAIGAGADGLLMEVHHPDHPSLTDPGIPISALLDFITNNNLR